MRVRHHARIDCTGTRERRRGTHASIIARQNPAQLGMRMGVPTQRILGPREMSKKGTESTAWIIAMRQAVGLPHAMLASCSAIRFREVLLNESTSSN